MPAALISLSLPQCLKENNNLSPSGTRQGVKGGGGRCSTESYYYNKISNIPPLSIAWGSEAEEALEGGEGPEAAAAGSGSVDDLTEGADYK